MRAGAVVRDTVTTSGGGDRDYTDSRNYSRKVNGPKCGVFQKKCPPGVGLQAFSSLDVRLGREAVLVLLAGHRAVEMEGGTELQSGRLRTLISA